MRCIDCDFLSVMRVWIGVGVATQKKKLDLIQRKKFQWIFRDVHTNELIHVLNQNVCNEVEGGLKMQGKGVYF